MPTTQWRIQDLVVVCVCVWGGGVWFEPLNPPWIRASNHFNIDNSLDNLPLNDYLTIPISTSIPIRCESRHQFADWKFIIFLGGACKGWIVRRAFLWGTAKGATPLVRLVETPFDLSDIRLAGQAKLADDEVTVKRFLLFPVLNIFFTF